MPQTLYQTLRDEKLSRLNDSFSDEGLLRVSDENLLEKSRRWFLKLIAKIKLFPSRLSFAFLEVKTI